MTPELELHQWVDHEHVYMLEHMASQTSRTRRASEHAVTVRKPHNEERGLHIPSTFCNIIHLLVGIFDN